MSKKLLSDEELRLITGGSGQNFNVKGFGKCLLNNGAAAIPALAEMVLAIIGKDWTKVTSLLSNPAISGMPIVKKCREENS